MLSSDLIKGARKAGEYIGISQKAVYNMVENGQLPVIRRGKLLFFRRSELEQTFRSDAT